MRARACSAGGGTGGQLQAQLRERRQGLLQQARHQIAPDRRTLVRRLREQRHRGHGRERLNPRRERPPKLPRVVVSDAEGREQRGDQGLRQHQPGPGAHEAPCARILDDGGDPSGVGDEGMDGGLAGRFEAADDALALGAQCRPRDPEPSRQVTLSCTGCRSDFRQLVGAGPESRRDLEAAPFEHAGLELLAPADQHVFDQALDVGEPRAHQRVAITRPARQRQPRREGHHGTLAGDARLAQPSGDVPEGSLEVLGVGHPVDLVDQHHEGQALSADLLEHHALAVLERLSDVEQPERNVSVSKGGARGRSVSAVGRVEPRCVGDLELAQQLERRVDAHLAHLLGWDLAQRAPELGVHDDAIGTAVAALDAREAVRRPHQLVLRRRRRQYTDGRDVLAEQRVDQRRLARVELADDGDSQGSFHVTLDLGDVGPGLEVGQPPRDAAELGDQRAEASRTAGRKPVRVDLSAQRLGVVTRARIESVQAGLVVGSSEGPDQRVRGGRQLLAGLCQQPGGVRNAMGNARLEGEREVALGEGRSPAFGRFGQGLEGVRHAAVGDGEGRTQHRFASKAHVVHQPRQALAGFRVRATRHEIRQRRHEPRRLEQHRTRPSRRCADVVDR